MRPCVSCGGPIPEGKRADAKKCHGNCDGAARQRKSYAKNPERNRANWLRYSRSDYGIVSMLLNNAKDRARKSGVSFDLSREFIEKKLEAGACELSGIQFVRMPQRQHRAHPFAPSLDKIDPTKGYVDGNVRMLCFAVNQARSDFGDEVLLTVAAALVKHLTR